MIVNLPTEKDLEAAAIDYLYMALSEAISVVRGEELFVEIQRDVPVDDDNVFDLVQEYWVSVRKQLAKSASLLQMGTELLLKARIAGISPYLLIDTVSSWPKKSTQRNVHFDEFRTVDARVLPQILNTVSETRLNGRFLQTIERIRERRNAIVHAASDRAVPTSKAIVLDVLEVSANLVGEGRWPELHRAQASAPPFSRIDFHDQIQAGLLDDFEVLLELLSPAEAKRHLGLSKKQRRYYCPMCRLGDLAPDAKVASLRPNRPDSTTLHCLACGKNHVVSRKDCSECAGNVIDEDGSCLSCGEDLE